MSHLPGGHIPGGHVPSGHYPAGASASAPAPAGIYAPQGVCVAINRVVGRGTCLNTLLEGSVNIGVPDLQAVGFDGDSDRCVVLGGVTSRAACFRGDGEVSVNLGQPIARVVFF